LEEANKAVADMRIVLEKLKPELAASTIKCGETMQQIMIDKKAAAEKQAIVAV